MNSLPVCLIAGIALLWSPSPARADEASKAAKAAELIQLTQGEQMMKAMEPMMNGMMAQAEKDMPPEQRAKAGELREKMLAMITAGINKARPAFAKAYTDTYTEEEIDGILTFYKSPVGKTFIQKMPEAMQRLMPAMMQMMTDMQPQMKALLEEMKAKGK